MDANIEFSSRAAHKVRELIDDEGNPALKLRVFITGGGCSGFSYGFTFDDGVADDDAVIERDGVTAVVDPMSYQYLAGRRDRLPGGSRRRAVHRRQPQRLLNLRLRQLLRDLTGRYADVGERLAVRISGIHAV